jgi:tetratricopeptide (TPR) repeat protein
VTSGLLFLAALALPSRAVAQDISGGDPPSQSVQLETRLSWLQENAETPAAEGVLSGVLADTRRVEDLLSLSDIIVRLPSREAQHAAYIRIATTLQSARRFAEAAQYYDLAFRASGGTDYAALFNRARILYELGDAVTAGALVRTVLAETSDYEMKRRAYTLAAEIAYDSGRGAEARRMLETLISLDDPDLVEVESLQLYRRILEEAGDTAGVSRVDGILARLFPESLAVALATESNRSLRAAGLPSELAGAPFAEAAAPVEPASFDDDASDGGTTAAGTAVRRDQPRLSGVQVGSFSDPDNATHLTRDLLELGLDARTESISREGTTLYQVSVHIENGDPRDAARVLAVLRTNGYDGFLVY